MSGPDDDGVAPEGVARRLAVVRSRIVTAGGDPERVRIVAVTKTFGPDAVRGALAAGLTDVGENYARELLATASASYPRPVRWHFLGAIQRRDVPRLAGVVAVYEGVDRLEEGEAIARHAPGAAVFVELGVSEIAGRPGIAPRDAGKLIDALRRCDLDVSGVMTVAPPGGGADALRSFRVTRQVADDFGLAEVSMGMSDDLEAAVAAGSTEVRIGRALFGAREAGAHGVTMGN